ncbi:MAG TPA: peptidoglycan DD-metalloendopeptidase family protein [Hyphomicrobiales bacterium]|nr:peptidoglycan DD-metalloendopeptidase family protein [Hyphomicrobiales bacterium]
MRRGGLLGLLCAALLASALSPAQDPANEAELQRLTGAIAKVKKELDGTRRQRGEAQQALEDAERRVSTLQQDMAATLAALTQTQTRLDALQQQADVLAAQREGQQTLIAAYLRQAWRQGEQPRLKLLLNQEDPQLAARMLRYHAYLNQARSDLVRGFTDNLTHLENVRADLALQRSELDARQEALATQERELGSARQERQDTLAVLDRTLASQDAELDRLEMARVEIEVLLEELRRSVNELTPSGADEPLARLKGKLPWPVEGRVTHRFGSRHELGDLTWEGLNFAAAAGSPVRAVHHGRVVYADWFGNSGLLLILDHGDGYMTLYAHNQELYKAVGEWAGAGEVVAAAGNTGGQRESGLYFELRHNGRAEDPAPWLLSRN